MLICFVGAFALAMQISAQAPPTQILQIYRQHLKSGTEAAFGKIEEETARICAQLGCPHPYLAIESLTGSKEVWFFNGYKSSAEKEQVYLDYAKNAPLMSALKKQGEQKADLTRGPDVEVFANYRRDLSSGVPWSLGHGRFLVITATRSDRRILGTGFTTTDGTRFFIMPARSRKEAEAAAAVAGPESNVYAVRHSWSFPAKEWIAADPVFWQPSLAAK